MSNLSLPKEIIALSKISNWNAIREFLKEFLKLTIKKELPYELIVLNDEQEESAEESVINRQIKTTKDIQYLNKITSFNSISIYQFNQYYENNLYLTQNQSAIIFFAKYMSAITNKLDLECFDFIVMLDSTSNPIFLSNTGKEVDYTKIINIFDQFDSKYFTINPTQIPDEKLESSIFESISGKNAIWGDSETKAFTSWKEKMADLFRSFTEKNAYYGGNLTKKYRAYLERMFSIWQKLSNNGQNDIKITTLKEFISFLDLF
ncbi:MAG: hypothetical protein BAJALOKI1v1_360002 [Promethearchaeota archaeon]|nr:MAG: hypothetical protein BAJALOKI1v1_360002 [Candidatus Lokiarchaeota archaeon]